MSNTHPFVHLTTFAGDVVSIDREIAPLITALWKREIGTIACCQGDPGGRATIVFPSATDLERALTLAHDLAPRWMRSAIAMRHAAADRWHVEAWAKLWWDGSRLPETFLDGPAPFYYQLTLGSGHLRHLCAPLPPPSHEPSSPASSSIG